MKRALVYRTSAIGWYSYRTDTSTDIFICIGCLLYRYSSTPIQPAQVRIGQSVCFICKQKLTKFEQFYLGSVHNSAQKLTPRGWQFRVSKNVSCFKPIQTDTKNQITQGIAVHAHFDPSCTAHSRQPIDSCHPLSHWKWGECYILVQYIVSLV